jgi:acyl carrier protein
MSPEPQAVQDLIAASLVQLRADLGLPELPSMNGTTALLGGDSDLDSMAVVHLIVDLEGRLQEAYGKNWILADERALSRRRSPFRTIGDLSDFIIETTPDS